MRNEISDEQIELLKTRIGDPEYPYLNKENFDKFLNGVLKDPSRRNVDDFFKPSNKLIVLESFKENILSYYGSSVIINSNEIIKAYDLDIFEDSICIISKLKYNVFLISLDQLARALDRHPIPDKYTKIDIKLKYLFKVDGYDNLFFMTGKGGNIFTVILRFHKNLNKWHLSSEEIFDKGYCSGSRVFISNSS